jgi:pantothenate kinase
MTLNPIIPELDDLAADLITKLARCERYLLGITGIPGAGKSTFSNYMAEAINRLLSQETAIVVPMDGFHLTNSILQARQLQLKKGAPETFDAIRFTQTLKLLGANTQLPIKCPTYDRHIHDPVEDAFIVDSRHRIVITEGNYLLLTEPPWSELKSLLNEVWFLQVEKSLALRRLLRRHMEGGMTATQAAAQIERVDIPNVRLIQQTGTRADRLLELSDRVSVDGA